jgi:hypothetical protein
MESFDRTFFMDGIEMDVAALEKEETVGRGNANRWGGDEDEDDDDDMIGYADLRMAREEMEKRRQLDQEAYQESSSSRMASSPVNTTRSFEDDDNDVRSGGGDESKISHSLSPNIYNTGGGGSDLMQQLWEEEQRKAQAYARGMKDALPWDDEDGEGDDAGPRLPSGEEFEGEVDPDALIPEDAPVPKMEKHFYEKLDGFLKSGPPPSVAGKISGGSSKTKGLKSDVDMVRAVMGGGAAAAASGSSKRGGAGNGSGNGTSGRTSTKKMLASKIGKPSGRQQQQNQQQQRGQRPLDENLLHQAFDYVQEVVSRASQEDAEQAEEAAQKAREAAFNKMRGSKGGGGYSDNQLGDGPYIDLGGGAGAPSTDPRGSKQQGQGQGQGQGGQKRSGGARSAPSNRKGGSGGGNNHDDRAGRASSSGSGGSGKSDSSMVRKLRSQAQAYSDNDRNPGAGPSAGGRNVRASNPSGSSRGVSNKAGGGGSGIGGSKKKPVGKPVDYGGSNVFESRAQGGFDTSTTVEEGFANASGNYNRGSYKGNSSGSGLREGAKNALDMRALVTNFESGEGVAKLRAELERSQSSMKKSEAFARQAMGEANFR